MWASEKRSCASLMREQHTSLGGGWEVCWYGHDGCRPAGGPQPPSARCVKTLQQAALIYKVRSVRPNVPKPHLLLKDAFRTHETA